MSEFHFWFVFGGFTEFSFNSSLKKIYFPRNFEFSKMKFAIPKNFKIWIFNLNLPFSRENQKKFNKGEFLDFSVFILYMNFSIFLKVAMPIMVFAKFQKSYIGWIHRVISAQKLQFRLANFWNFSEFSHGGFFKPFLWIFNFQEILD